MGISSLCLVVCFPRPIFWADGTGLHQGMILQSIDQRRLANTGRSCHRSRLALQECPDLLSALPGDRLGKMYRIACQFIDLL